MNDLRLISKCVTGIKTILHLFFLLFILSLSQIYGQKSDLKFKYITVDQGLSSNRVFCMYRDNKQFLWIGTDMGLNRYDGYQTIKKYFHNDSVERSLSDNTVRCINEDSKGNLFAGTSQGLNLYDKADDSFTLFNYDSNNPNSISSGNINSMYLDKKGNFWIMAGGNCLNKWVPEKKQFVRYKFKEDDKAFYNSTQSIAEDSKGNIWVVSYARGIYCLQPGADKLIEYKGKGIDFGDKTTKSLYIDEQDIIWIASNGGGFHSFDPSNGKTEHYYTNENGKGVNQKLLRWVIAENNRYLLIAVNQGGINRFDKLTKTFEYITYNGENESGLNNNGVWTLYKDKEGILWAGTGNGGVNYYNPKEYNFELFRHTNNSAISPSDNTIGGFYEDSQGMIWIATDGQGVNLFDPSTKKFKVFKHNPANPFSISGNTIRNFEEDNDHNLWIGTWDNGLNKYDRKTGKFHSYMPLKNDPSSISGQGVWHIKKDWKGLLWLSIYGKGIEIFDKDKGVIKRFNIDAKHPEANSSIPQFVEDGQRYMWACSWKGMYRYDRTTDKFTAFKNFPDNDIRTFYKDSRGNYWAGSFNKGLFLMNFDGKIKKVYNDKNGLPNNQIHAIVEDLHGNLWISTNFGISQFNPVKETFKNYFKSDGLQGNQFFTLSYLKTRSGKIYFGGFNGFNAFYPDNLKTNQTLPPVYFTSFEIFNRPASYGKPGSPLQSDISEVKQIILPWSQSVFSLGFTAVNYTFSQKNQYAYKLENFDKDWNYVGSTRSATYTNLDPGEYIFKVKASNNDGFWNEQGTSVKIIITPPLWMTWWFKTGVLFLITGSAAAFYFLRMNAVKAQKRQLEQKVREQTAQLLTSNLQLLTANEQERKARLESDDANRAKSIFLATMSHEIRTPMNGVIGMASLLLQTEQSDEQRGYTQIISTSGENLLSVINGILDFSKIESGKMELENTLFDLQTCIKEALDIFSFKASETGLRLAYHINSDVPSTITGDSLRLRQVLINLIGNAMKFTAAGEIFIGVHLLKPVISNTLLLEFEVRDTGIGIPADKIERLFKAFSQVDPSATRKHGGTGLGLVICEKLVKLMGGDISVSSVLGKGTTFTFSIQTIATQTQLAPVSSKVSHYTTLDNHVAPKQTDELKLTTDFSMQYPLRILIAEDNPINVMIVNKILSKLGYKTETVENGRKVLDILKEQDFDLIFMDVQMPEMDGLEATRTIRKNNKVKPAIIAMTANAMKGDREECLEAGMNDYISKPINLNALVSILQKWGKQIKANIEEQQISTTPHSI